jgi:hypothetical protein
MPLSKRLAHVGTDSTRYGAKGPVENKAFSKATVCQSAPDYAYSKPAQEAGNRKDLNTECQPYLALHTSVHKDGWLVPTKATERSLRARL